jgi:hypothetical protein
LQRSAERQRGAPELKRRGSPNSKPNAVPAVVELGGTGVAVACGLLHVFELRAVFKRVVIKVARIECAESPLSKQIFPCGG